MFHPRFYQFLAMNMQKESKPVYAASAEVVGMALGYLQEAEKGVEQRTWRDEYVDNLGKMLLAFQQSKPDRFVSCVYRLQLHYPPIADRYDITENNKFKVQNLNLTVKEIIVEY